MNMTLDSTINKRMMTCYFYYYCDNQMWHLVNLHINNFCIKLQYIILPATRVSSLYDAIRCLWGPGFPIPGLLSVSCRMYGSRMCMAYLSYELSSYNMAKMAERSENTRDAGSMTVHISKNSADLQITNYTLASRCIPSTTRHEILRNTVAMSTFNIR